MFLQMRPICIYPMLTIINIYILGLPTHACFKLIIKTMIKKSVKVEKSFFKFLMLFSEMEMKGQPRSISRSKVVKSRKGKRHQRQLETRRV